MIVLAALFVVAVAVGGWWSAPTVRVNASLKSVPLPADAVLVEETTRHADGCFVQRCSQRFEVYSTSLEAKTVCDLYAVRISEDWSDANRLDLGQGAAVCGWVGVIDGVMLGAVVEQVGEDVEIVLSGRPLDAE